MFTSHLFWWEPLILKFQTRIFSDNHCYARFIRWGGITSLNQRLLDPKITRSFVCCDIIWFCCLNHVLLTSTECFFQIKEGNCVLIWGLIIFMVCEQSAWIAHPVTKGDKLTFLSIIFNTFDIFFHFRHPSPIWHYSHSVCVWKCVCMLDSSGSRDSSVVRTLDLWSKGRGYESLLERRG